MTKGEKIEKIKEYFPEVEKIKDLKFKNAVIDIWVRVWEESTWDDLNECPFNPAFPDISLISHVNTVLELVMSSAFILEKNYPELKFDQDLLITGVLLHDVSKVVEIKKGDDGKPTFSEMTKVMPHAVYGAHLSMAHGLPLKVANVILSHTRLTGTLPQSKEAVLLHYIDYGMADVLRSNRSLKLLLDGGPT
ncbi:MAG: hypothetical protein DRP55_05290, partial [Spirochaetes bacterium]